MTRPSRFLSDIDTRFLKLQMSNSMGGEDNFTFANPVAKYAAGSNPAKPSRSSSAYSKSAGAPSGFARLGDNKSVGSAIKPQHTASELSEGMTIHHERFGNGTVVKIAQISGEDMITVDFGVVGIKKLLLKFAKIEIVK